MIFRAGTFGWLAAHEMRLGWRGIRFAGTGRRRLLLLIGFFVLATAFAGVPLGHLLRGRSVLFSPTYVVAGDLAAAVIFTLMMSQTLAAATDTLYSRGDLDLLFSSPIAPTKVLGARLAAIAGRAFAGFALLASPFLLPVALIGHPSWVGFYGVLAAIAMAAAAAGVVLAIGLFRLIGARRTRAVAQVLAALIGGAVFLSVQARNILGAGRVNVVAELVRRLARNGPPPAFMTFPLRAAVGDGACLTALVATGGALFAAASVWVGRRFDADAALASGAGLAGPRHRKRTAPFAAGAFAATMRKEWRLLLRDITLLSQVILRLLYLVPITFMAIRSGKGLGNWSEPAAVAAVTFMAGQVAGSLAWITVSAEDAPELLAAAPAPAAVIDRAKLTAALLPLGALMSVPLLVLTAASPLAGCAAILGCAAAALASGLINLWWRRPAKRADFLRRRGGSWAIAVAEFAVGALIAGAAGLAARRSLLTLAPALLAAGMVLLMYAGRSRTRIRPVR